MSTWSYPSEDTDFYAANAQAYHAPRSTGVYSSDVDFIATATSAMNVEVSIGIAWMLYDRLRGASFVNDAAAPLTVAMADGYRARIDRVVGRKDFVTNTSYLYIKQGTPAASPIAPTMQRDAEAYEMCFADIRIPAGTIQLTQGMISNAIKLDESVCGIVRDGVERIPSQQLYNDWWAWFSRLQGDAEQQAADFIAWIEIFKARNEAEAVEWFADFTAANTSMVNDWRNTFISTSESTFYEWFENLQNQLDDNQAANLQNQINHHLANGINSSAGVHNLRYVDGKLQAFIGTGWVTVATADRGYSWEYMESTLSWGWVDLEVQEITWEDIENRIEEEAA